jgi:type II secretory pathway component GspD/PulD (secretin)
MQPSDPRTSSGASRTAPAAWRLALALVALLSAIVAQAQEMQVIELRHRLASEVIPIVQPLLETGGVITGMDAMLFVRTSPANLAQIRQAVDALDRKPRQLLVTVGQGTVTNVDSSSVRGSATIGSGDVQVGVNRPPGAEPGASVRVDNRSQRADLTNVSSVRALEGMETFIAIGQSVPVTTTQVTRGWGGTLTQQSTEFHSASTGFYATVRVSGETVTLEISPQQQRLRASVRGGPVVETSGAMTTVSGRLGEWLALGAVQESSTSGTGGLLAWGRQAGSSQYSAWARVDEVP